MKMENLDDQGVKHAALPARHGPDLRLDKGVEPLFDFADLMDDVQATLQDIAELGGSEADRKSTKLIRQLRAIEPSITMIGQIKSGKTSLVNAMIGRPGLLPVDVNPWTSVVTSLHMNRAETETGPAATFQFFDHDEWDHLVENGGRLGELSSRAGADEELAKVREQISAMREKTRQRLGRKFELLLGQKHDYDKLNEDLVRRYVCMGDDFDAEDQQGRFADITKSADLYIESPVFPMPLCVRDTPGVNDTFMMRERITINALRNSRICVLVLSAHQALSSMDMALIRLIANVKSREVVIFVNRIDELADPSAQVPEIRASLIDTLARHDGPKDPCIIFGSAYWANLALSGTLDEVDADSSNAMLNWAQTALDQDADDMSAEQMAWEMSGLPDLYDALSERIIEGEGSEALATVRRRALNLARGLAASGQMVTLRIANGEIPPIDSADLAARLDRIESNCLAVMHEKLDDVFAQFGQRVDQTHKRFLDRALESLLQSLEKHGENEIWQYSADGLRMLLRSGYQVLRRNYATACDEIFAQSSAQMENLCIEVFGLAVENFSIESPAAPEIPPPVALGQTIALDLQTNWWKSWWHRRKGYRAYAKGFYDLIEAETAPIVDELRVNQTMVIRAQTETLLRDFLAEQRGNLLDISEKATVSLDDLKGLFGVSAQEERAYLFDLIIEELSDPD